MYCPMCGAKLESEDQKFCQNCGSEIINPSETQIEKTEPSSTEEPAPKIKETKPEEPSIEDKESEITTKDYSSQKPEEKDLASNYAGKCLAYAIISIIIFGIYSGMISFRGERITSGGSYYPILGLVFTVITLILSIIGLIFATSSRKISKKASELDPDNTVEKVGSSLAIVGLVLNIIGIIMTVVVTGLSILAVISILIGLGIFP
ncbi:MAG: zinc-ribbon domain-containing protein [Promethearchaeati archaeon]